MNRTSFRKFIGQALAEVGMPAIPMPIILRIAENFSRNDIKEITKMPRQDAGRVFRYSYENLLREFIPLVTFQMEKMDFFTEEKELPKGKP